MDIQVRFRFNKRTGEVEEFVVEAGADDLPEAEHNRLHEQRSAELARLLERNPRVTEVHTAPAPRPAETEPEDTDGPARTTRRDAP